MTCHQPPKRLPGRTSRPATLLAPLDTKGSDFSTSGIGNGRLVRHSSVFQMQQRRHMPSKMAIPTGVQAAIGRW